MQKEVIINGKPYAFKMSLGAIEAVEKATGRSLMRGELVFDTTMVIEIAFQGMKAAGGKLTREEVAEELTLNDVRPIVEAFTGDIAGQEIKIEETSGNETAPQTEG
jgi:hypothetical protein